MSEGNTSNKKEEPASKGNTSEKEEVKHLLKELGNVVKKIPETSSPVNTTISLPKGTIKIKNTTKSNTPRSSSSIMSFFKSNKSSTKESTKTTTNTTINPINITNIKNISTKIRDGFIYIDITNLIGDYKIKETNSIFTTDPLLKTILYILAPSSDNKNRIIYFILKLVENKSKLYVYNTEKKKEYTKNI